MNPIGRLSASVSVLLVLVTGTWAEETACPHQHAIVSLADSIIEKRNELAGFPQRNFGTDAAYLKIRYEDLPDAEAEPLLAALIEGRARYARDLAFAWSYGRPGGAMERLLGDADAAIEEAISTSNRSGLRAMIARGDADLLIDALARLPDNTAIGSFNTLMAAVIDLPDSIKADLAASALKAGEPLLAAGLTALLGKPEAWTSLTKALHDPTLIEQATFMWRWAPALVGNPELPPPAGAEPPANPSLRQQIHEVSITAAMEPQVSFLMTLLNQTGLVDEVAAAADAVRAAIDDGTIDRDGLYGPGWLIAYRALRDVWSDPRQLESQLGSFEVNIGTRGGATPRELLDILIAVEALAPYVRGDTDDLPVHPSEVSADFATQWDKWTETAQRLRGAASDPSLADEATLPIAAELMLAAGRSDAIAGLVAGSPATSALLNLANDVALRLDRLCESYLAHPAEAVMFNGGLQIYKFDR